MSDQKKAVRVGLVFYHAPMRVKLQMLGAISRKPTTAFWGMAIEALRYEGGGL